MKRLLRKASDDEMNFDETKQETLQAIKNMSKRTNEWAIRDTLIQFTSWGFYKGQQMAIIDEDVAMNICKQLYNYVKNIGESQENNLYEVYDKVYHYSR
jgi:hypothetical protein